MSVDRETGILRAFADGADVGRETRAAARTVLCELGRVRGRLQRVMKDRAEIHRRLEAALKQNRTDGSDKAKGGQDE